MNGRTGTLKWSPIGPTGRRVKKGAAGSKVLATENRAYGDSAGSPHFCPLITVPGQDLDLR